MTGVLFLFLHQQSIILRNSCGQEIFLFDQMSAQGAAHHAACDQTVGSSRGADGGGAGHTEIFQYRTESTGGAVSAYHGNGACAHAHQGINVQYLG